MSTFFFYTNPALLGTQTAEQAFGPISNISPSSDLFQVSHWHSIGNGEDLPIVAVCDGILCAQYDEHGKISLILKPDYQPLFDFPFIKYFVYRGIHPDSLIDITDNSKLIESGSTFDNDLTKRLRDNWLNANNYSDLTDSYKVLGLDRNTSYLTKENNKIFEDHHSIDNLFLHENTIQLAYALRGEVIAYAQGKFGFGIIRDQHWQSVPISQIRTQNPMVQVDANPGNETERLKAKKKAETTLSYLDPCTFLSGFQNFKLKYINTDKEKEKKEFSKAEKKDLFLKFQNRSKIYIYPNHIHNFTTKPAPIKITVNGDLISPSIWPQFTVENVQQEKLKIILSNWDDLYLSGLDAQAEVQVRGSMNESQTYLFGNYSEEYFHSTETVQIDIDCEKLFLDTEKFILSTYLELYIKDDISIYSIREFVIPPLKNILDVRSKYLHYSYDTIFRSTEEIGFDNYEAYFSGAFFDEAMSVLFYTPILSKNYDTPKTRAFINENYECANADFFDTFFAQKHILIKNLNPDNSYYCNFIFNVNEEYESLLNEDFSNYYYGFTSFVFTPNEYSNLKNKIDNLSINHYRFILDDITPSDIYHYRKYQIKLLYYEEDSGDSILKMDDLNDLNIQLVSNIQYDNHFFISTLFVLTDDLIQFLEIEISSEFSSRKNKPPLISRLFAEDKVLNAINQGKLVLNDEVYNHFELINRTEFVKKIFQAISIVWPELPSTTDSTISERIQSLEKIWLESKSKVTFNHLHTILDQLSYDINYYFSLAHTESGQDLLIYFRSPLADYIDYKLIIFLDEELNRINIYREDDKTRPRTIFNIGKAQPVGKYSVTWKEDAYFDYATVCRFIFKEIFDTLEENLGKIDEEMIRDYPGTPNYPSPLKPVEPLMEERIALSLILVDKLRKEKLIELGSGPTDQLTHVFYSDTQESFFDKFYIYPNSPFYIGNWDSNPLFTSYDEYNKMIDRLFYYLIHYAIPTTEIQPDFFYHLFYYPEKLENYLTDYAPKGDNSTPKQITIIESINMFNLLKTEFKIIAGKGLSFKNIKENKHRINNSQCKSFCEEILDFESNYIGVYKEPIEGGEIIAYLPVNQTIYLDFVSIEKWFKVKPQSSKIVRKKDQIHYLHNGKYYNLDDLVKNSDNLPEGISEDSHATTIYKVEYNCFDRDLSKKTLYKETYNLKSSTRVPIYEDDFIRSQKTKITFIDGDLVFFSSPESEEYRPDYSNIEILENLSYYLPAQGSVRLSSPCPAPHSLLYKIKRHNIELPTNGKYKLKLRSNPEDGLLDVAQIFYGDSGVLTQKQEDPFSNEEEKKDNHFFANVIFYANNPHGYDQQPFEVFSINDGGFITNGVGLDYKNNIDGLRFTFSVKKDENDKDKLPKGLSLGKVTGIISGIVEEPTQSYEINVNILVEESLDKKQATWKERSTHAFTFNWVIDPAGSNSPPTKAKPEDQYNCVDDSVWLNVLPVRNAAVFHKDREFRKDLGEGEIFKSIEGNEIEPISEIDFAWDNAKLRQDYELWIPSLQHALSLASVVPDPDKNLGNLGFNLKDYVNTYKESFFKILDFVWPKNVGFQLDLGIGATFVYPVGVDGQFLFYVLREEKSKFRVIRRGSIQGGIDASVGVGFYAGRKNKWKLRGRKSKEKHAVGAALKAEANARVMAGLYLQEEFVFDLDDGGIVALLMLLTSTVSMGGTAIIDAFGFLGVSPYDYMIKSKYGAFITASAAAGGTAKLQLVPDTYKDEEGNTKKLPQPPPWKGVNHDSIDESNYTDKPDGFLGVLMDIFGFSASNTVHIEVNAEFHIKP